jgi:hypothetical protein
MRFDLDGHTFEGPEPTGFDLYDKVWTSLAQMGFAHICPTGVPSNPQELAQLMTLGRLLMATPQGRALVGHTLAGWTVDGVPLTNESILTIFGVAGRRQEPGAASVRIWREAGFFRLAGAGAVEALPPTPTPESD